MAIKLEDTLKEMLGHLTFQLAQTQTSVAQLAAKVQELELKLKKEEKE